MQKIFNFSLKTRKGIFKGKKCISLLKNQGFYVIMFKSTKRFRFSSKPLILKCRRNPTFIKRTDNYSSLDNIILYYLVVYIIQF